MNRFKGISILLLITFGLFTSCKTYHATGEYISMIKDDKIINLSENKINGEACMWYIFLIPFGTMDLLSAYNDAIKKAPPGTTGISSMEAEMRTPVLGGAILGKWCTLVSGYPAKR